MEGLGAGRGAAARDDRVARLHVEVDDVRISLDVAVELGVGRPPVDEVVVGLLVFPADDDRLDAVRMFDQRGQQVDVIVGALIAFTGREEHPVKSSGRSPRRFSRKYPGDPPG